MRNHQHQPAAGVDDCTIPTARCPKCGRPSATTSAANLKAFYCHTCDMEFEAEDDGDIGRRSAESNAIAREEYQIRRQQRGGMIRRR